MKIVSVCFLMAMLGLAFSTVSWAQCPEDSVDLGTCDTLYIECYDCASVSGSPPWNVHLILSVTHDLAESFDSIQGFVIPLTYYGRCDFLPDSNTNDLSGPGLSKSIFRDFGGKENRMLDLEQLSGGQSWDTRTIQIDTTAKRFFISLSASGDQDRNWWEGSRVLLATLTLKIDRPTLVLIDTTYWVKGTSLNYTRGDGKPYSPRLSNPRGFFVKSRYGDINSDGHVRLGDLIYLVNYFFKDGPAPIPLCMGDMNGDAIISMGDLVYLKNYLCQGGPAPVESCDYWP